MYKQFICSIKQNTHYHSESLDSYSSELIIKRYIVSFIVYRLNNQSIGGKHYGIFIFHSSNKK